MRAFGRLLLSLLCVTSVISNGWAEDVTILSYGANKDGKTVNTVAVQRAIDACFSSGGGRVLVPSGVFVCGTIYLRSGVNLVIEQGAVLKGSDQLSDYRAVKGTPALIVAQDVDHIAISGQGVIDGNGHASNFQKGDNGRGRPMLIFFVDCRHVTVSGIHLRSPAFWTEKYSGCEDVRVTGISVYAHANWNNDGIDIDSKNVVVSDCIFDTDDDAICLKSERDAPCENVTITNCVAASNCNAIKMGTASRGGFQNINISGITIHAASEDNIRHWRKSLKGITADKTVISGIAIEDVDGGHTNQINISHIVMRSVQTPIFIRLGDRRQPAGSLEQVMISDVIATSESEMCNVIAGIPGVPVEGVRIHHMLMIAHAASDKPPLLADMPENTQGYPENRMFGTTLPAGGFFIRHAKDIQLEDISVKSAPGETRPFLAAEDVRMLAVSRSSYAPGEGAYARMFRLRDVADVVIAPLPFSGASEKLIAIEGHASGIRVYLDKMTAARDVVSAEQRMPLKDVIKIIAPGGR